MFNEVSRETLTEDIHLATMQGLLLQSSADFLLNKLNQLANSDNSLTDIEIRIIEKQLNYHKNLLSLRNDFDVKQYIMRDIVKKNISNLFNKMD